MKLEWTEPSLLDLESIRDYIIKDSAYYAARFIERIIEAVESLREFPDMGRIVHEAETETIRELLFQSYRIMYLVESDRVLILTVLHGSREIGLIDPKPWDIV